MRSSLLTCEAERIASHRCESNAYLNSIICLNSEIEFVYKMKDHYIGRMIYCSGNNRTNINSFCRSEDSTLYLSELMITVHAGIKAIYLLTPSFRVDGIIISYSILLNYE